MPFRAKANVTLFQAKNGTKQKLLKQRHKGKENLDHDVRIE